MRALRNVVNAIAIRSRGLVTTDQRQDILSSRACVYYRGGFL